MTDGVKQREQLATAISISQQRKSDHRPDRSVRILATILTNTWRITFDIARIQLALVEGRRKEQYQSIAAPDQIFINSGHSARRPMVVRRTRNYTPRLRD